MDKLDVLGILGGSLLKEPDGKWRLFGLEDYQYKNKALGSNLRVLAGNVLFKRLSQKSKCLVLVSGGRGKNCTDPTKPTLSSVMKRGLIDLGLPEECIIENPDSNSTYEQLLGLEAAMQNKIGIIGIISNEYHLPRIQAFFDYRPELDPLRGRAVLISAEQVLIETEPELWRKRIYNAYRNSALQNIMAAEKNGVNAIKNGEYKFYVS